MMTSAHDPKANGDPTVDGVAPDRLPAAAGARISVRATDRYAMRNPDAATSSGSWQPETRLYSEAAFPGVDGTVLAPVGTPARRVAGTPFLDPASTHLAGALEPTREQIETCRARVAGSRLPRSGPFHEMATTALLDTYALRQSNGAVLGAGSPYWAFVWPRDNSLVVTAFTLMGLSEEAWAALQFIYSVQEPDGQWEARYLPDGSGEVPDERGRQDDGIGYTLWATWVATQLDAAGADSWLATLRPAIVSAIEAAIDVIDEHTGLPRTSQDFWEMDQAEPSLGVAGPLHFGLRCGVHLARALGTERLAARAHATAELLRNAIATSYGSINYQRFPSGGGRDASVAFLLPPFTTTAFDGAREAWHRTLCTMRVPNGGLRPGEEWPDEETAWNTQTSLYAITAAALGERSIAEELLTWMQHRRTALGCLPEKVTATGRPAAVAPISTVTASVLIAVALLDGARLPTPSTLNQHGGSR